MKQSRPGAPKKLHFRHDPWEKYGYPRNSEIHFIDSGEEFGPIVEIVRKINLLSDLPDGFLKEFLTKDWMRLLAKRYQELKARGYPDEWIQKDLKNLIEGV